MKAVVDAARERNIPIRVGVNSGSLEKALLEKYGLFQRSGRFRIRHGTAYDLASRLL